MLNNQARIILACLSGGGIGSLVALQASPLFWWVGLLVGAMTGYLTFDFRRVMEAIPTAFHAAQRIDLKPFFKEVKMQISPFPIFFVSIASWVIPYWVFISFMNGWRYLWGLMIFATLSSFLLALFFALVTSRQEQRDTFQKFALTVSLPSIVVYHIPKSIFEGVVALIRNLPRFLSFMKDFLWQFFVRIHSELRVLCAVDSAIGACVGYMAGSALIGAVVGALVGLLNYEIITKRVLNIRVPIDRDQR